MEGLELTFYDADADAGVTVEPSEVLLIEWDGFPDADFNASEWFMVEVEGDSHSYFVDVEDMDAQVYEFVIDYCEGVKNAPTELEGSEES